MVRACVSEQIAENKLLTTKDATRFLRTHNG
jgi:hypothetical protein